LGVAELSARLSDRRRGKIDVPTVTVFAHPDDETLACGAQLARFADLRMLLVTDGAPDTLLSARRRGFATVQAYAAARRGELEAALAVAGVSAARLESLGFADGRVVHHIARLARRLSSRLVGAGLVITHCYEGGHTDHDAVALAVHLACRLIAKSARPPRIIEAPLYNEHAGAWTPQKLPADGCGQEIVLPLSPEERARKQRMIACYASQRVTLARFGLAEERFRLDPQHDFSRLPNRGRVLYERQWAAMSGSQWLALATSAVQSVDPRLGEAAPAPDPGEAPQERRALRA
jgi:LmbE family N-acetylglucosaminyl deacetylase